MDNTWQCFVLFVITFSLVSASSLSHIFDLSGVSYYHSINLTGQGENVCVVGSGANFIHFRGKSKDFITDDWCIKGRALSLGYKDYVLHPNSSLDRLEIGLFWKNMTNRFDILVYNMADHELLFSSYSQIPDCNGEFCFFAFNISSPSDLIVRINYTSVQFPESPVITWGSSAVISFSYFHGSCRSSPNPVVDGDPRAFYNVIAHDDYDDISGAVPVELLLNALPNATILVAKVLDMDGETSIALVKEGIDWCVQQNASLIIMPSLPNSSFCHNSSFSQYLADLSSSVLFISPSENAFPSCFPSVLSVGDVDEDGIKGSYFYGVLNNRTVPDLLAFGDDIELDSTMGDKLFSSPTISTALVGAGAVLIKQYHRLFNLSLPPQLLAAYILASTNSFGCNADGGCGIFNASIATTLNHISAHLYDFPSLVYFDSLFSGKSTVFFYLPELDGNHSIVKMVVSSPYEGFYLDEHTHYYKHGFYSDGASSFTVNLSFVQTPFVNREYYLVYSKNLFLRDIDYGKRVFRKGYYEPVSVVVSNKNPIFDIQLEGIAVELWNSTGFVSDLSILTEHELLHLNPLSSKELNFYVYIPKTAPKDAFIKVRVFRFIKPLANSVTWSFGNEGQAVGPEATYSNYSDNDWIPYHYYNIDYPSKGRIRIAKSIHGLCIDPYSTFNKCTLYVDGKKPTSPIPWNDTLSLFFSCPKDAVARDLRPVEVFEKKLNVELISPIKPMFSINVISYGSLNRGRFSYINVELKNNMRMDVSLQSLVAYVINTTDDSIVAQIGGAGNVVVPALSTRTIHLSVYIPDTIPPSNELNIVVKSIFSIEERWDMKCYNWRVATVWDNTGYALWPARPPEFNGFCKRVVLVDENTNEMELTVRRSSTKDVYCGWETCDCPFFDYESSVGHFPGAVYLYVNGEYISRANGVVKEFCYDTACFDMGCIVAPKEEPFKRVVFNKTLSTVVINITDDYTRVYLENDNQRRPLLLPLLTARRHFVFSSQPLSIGQVNESISFLDVEATSTTSGGLGRITFSLFNHNDEPLHLVGIELIGEGSRRLTLASKTFDDMVIQPKTAKSFNFSFFTPSGVSKVLVNALFFYDVDPIWKERLPRKRVYYELVCGILGCTLVRHEEFVKNQTYFDYPDSDFTEKLVHADYFHRKYVWVPSSFVSMEAKLYNESLYHATPTSDVSSVVLKGNDKWNLISSCIAKNEPNLFSFLSSKDADAELRIYFNKSTVVNLSLLSFAEPPLSLVYSLPSSQPDQLSFLYWRTKNKLPLSIPYNLVVVMHDDVSNADEFIHSKHSIAFARTETNSSVAFFYIPKTRYYTSCRNFGGGVTKEFIGCGGRASYLLVDADRSVNFHANFNTADVGWAGFLFKGLLPKARMRATLFMNGKELLGFTNCSGACTFSRAKTSLQFIPCEEFSDAELGDYLAGTFILLIPLNNSLNISVYNPSFVIKVHEGKLAINPSNACSGFYSFCDQVINSTNFTIRPYVYYFGSWANISYGWKGANVPISSASSPEYDDHTWPFKPIKSEDGKAPPYSYRLSLYLPPSISYAHLIRSSELYVNGQDVGSAQDIKQFLDLGDNNLFTFKTTSSQPYANLLLNFFIPSFREPLQQYSFEVSPAYISLALIQGQNYTVSFSVLNTGNKDVNITIVSDNSHAIPLLSSLYLRPHEEKDVPVLCDGSDIGLFNITIKFTDKYAGEKTGFILLNVSGKPVFNFSVSPLFCSQQIDPGQDAMCTFVVENTGNQPLLIVVNTSNNSLLSPTPSFFQLQPGQQEAVVVSILSSSLENGTYDFSVLFDSGYQRKNTYIYLMVGKQVGGQNLTPSYNFTSLNATMELRTSPFVCLGQEAVLYVFYSNGTPVEDAALYMNGFVRDIFSDDQGVFRVKLPLGFYELAAVKDNERSNFVDISVIDCYSMSNISFNFTLPLNISMVYTNLTMSAYCVNISAPESAENGSTIFISAVFTDGKPYSGPLVVLGPDNQPLYLVVKQGMASFKVDKPGVYFYNTPNICMVRFVKTRVFSTVSAKAFKQLLISLSLNESSVVRLHTYVDGKLGKARVIVLSPNGTSLTFESDNNGILNLHLNKGKYDIVVVSLAQVNDLRADIMFPKKGREEPTLSENCWIILAFFIIILIILFVFRKIFRPVEVVIEGEKRVGGRATILFLRNGKPLCNAEVVVEVDKKHLRYNTGSDGVIRIDIQKTGEYKIFLKNLLWEDLVCVFRVEK